MEKMDFKALREAKGFTRDQIAEAVGVSEIAVGMWENGEGVPNTDRVITLCGLLDVCVEKLMHSFPWWEKEHGKEYSCSENCAECPNVSMLGFRIKAKEKSSSGEEQTIDVKNTIIELESLRAQVKNLNYVAGELFCGWLALEGGRVSDILVRAEYAAVLDKVIAYLKRETEV